MSWLYSFVFAGLLISANGESRPVNSSDHTTPAVTVIQKDETEKFEQSYPLSPNGRVSVSNINGSIEMIAWDRPEVRLEATKIADSAESLADVEIKVNARSDSFSVEADYEKLKWRDGSDKYKNRKLEVQFRLSVPRTAILNEIETVNGSITASNFVNVTKISAVNGSVTATNLRGTAELSTVNGTVAADFDRIEPGSKIDLETVNGRINLAIPSDSNVTVKADSLNGNITNAFGLPVRKGEYVGRDLYGRIGTGDVRISLSSVNGPLAINRKDDGKTPSPAVNLLQHRRDDNWESDTNQSLLNTQKMNREIQASVREAQRESAKAVREAQKEIAKIKIPELEKLKIKVDIDGKMIDQHIKEGLKAQSAALAQMENAMWLGGNGMVERKTKSFTVKGTPKVIVDAKNCNVKIRGWDKAEVKYVLTEMPGTFRRAPLSVNEDQSGSDVKITVSGGDGASTGWFPGDSGAPRMEIFVPRKANLKINTSGEVRLEGVSGELEIIGGEQSIDVRGSDGKLNVSNSDGVVRVVGFRGDVVANTVDGDVYLDGEFDRIDARSIDGKFVLTLPSELDAEIVAPETMLSTEMIPGATKTGNGNWKLGKGGRTYKFSSTDGALEFRDRDSISEGR